MKVPGPVIKGLTNWFKAAWPSPTQRAALGAQYKLVGSQKLFMRDIALRAGLIAPSPPDCSEYQAGFDAGRRSFAIEMIHATRCDPLVLMGLALEPKETDR